MKYKDYFGLCLNMQFCAIGICIGGWIGAGMLMAIAASTMYFLLKYAEPDEKQSPVCQEKPNG